MSRIQQRTGLAGGHRPRRVQYVKSRDQPPRGLAEKIIRRLLRQGGEVFIQTDVQERAETFVADLRAHGGFDLPEPAYLPGDNPFGARSNREKRAIEDGLPVFRILARKR